MDDESNAGGENRDRLLKKLEKTDAQDAELERNTREMLQTVRHQRDVTKALTATVKTFRDDAPLSQQRWNELNTVFDRHNAQAEAANWLLKKAVQPYQISTFANSTGVASMGSSIVETYSFTVTSPEDRDWYDNKYLPTATQLNEVMQQGGMKEQIERKMAELGLDQDRGEKKSPLMHLQEAYMALNQADGEFASAASILVPLRDCISAISAVLLQKRRNQVKTGGLIGQIESIGEQCRRDDVQRDYFPDLARRAHDLHNTYSGFKDKRILRQEVLFHFNAGISLIRSFLYAIAADKLR